MGNNYPLIYSTTVTNNNKDGESEIYRNPISKYGLITSPNANLRNLQDVINKSRKEFGNLPCLGTQNT